MLFLILHELLEIFFYIGIRFFGQTEILGPAHGFKDFIQFGIRIIIEIDKLIETGTKTGI